MNSSEETLARARVGDQAAFADIVRGHQAMVFSLARHFLRDHAVAEEVAQEVFLELYRHLDSIESPDHLRHWLRKVASNRCIDHARRSKRPHVGLDEVAEIASDQRQSDPILAGTLRRYVGTLPEAARMVVILRYQEDLDPSEIAQVLDMPVNTVKSHLQRSLALLRGKLGRCFGVVRA